MRAGLILAGGNGRRFGGTVPKQFVRLNGTPLLCFSIVLFREFFDFIEVIVHPSWKNKILSLPCYDKDIIITEGGKTRQESVFNGLKVIDDSLLVSLIAIHDAARPLISRVLLQKLLKKAFQKGSAIPAIPASDTMATANKGCVSGYPKRSELYSLQTPQIFQFEALLNAHKKARKDNLIFSDESSLMFHYGHHPVLCEGEKTNLKITTAEDLALAEFYLKNLNEGKNT